MTNGIPLKNRAYDCFISYAGIENTELAHKISNLLQDAGLSIWFDKVRMLGGAPVIDVLTNEICNSRAVLLLLTKAALEKSFVKHEIDIACHQQVTVAGFNLIAAIIDPTIDPVSRFPSLMKSSWVSFPDNEINIESITSLLLALTPKVKRDVKARHVYVSCGWGELEQPVNSKVCKILIERGVRLIGDETSRHEFGEEGKNRVQRIMTGCTGHLLILPERRSVSQKVENIYKYFLHEFEIGKSLELPRRIFCVSRDTIPGQFKEEAIEIGSGEDLTLYEQELIQLHDESEPIEPYVFLATDYKLSTQRNEFARKILEHILGMECWLGKDYFGEQLREDIINKIRTANIVITDLACTYDDDSKRLRINLNTSIEAGIAMGSKRPLFVTSLDPHSCNPATKDKTTQLPFMFRNSNVLWYKDDVDFLIKICRLALATKRRILNDETIG
jgi:hypothetical protein